MMGRVRSGTSKKIIIRVKEVTEDRQSLGVRIFTHLRLKSKFCSI